MVGAGQEFVLRDLYPIENSLTKTTMAQDEESTHLWSVDGEPSFAPTSLVRSWTNDGVIGYCEGGYIIGVFINFKSVKTFKKVFLTLLFQNPKSWNPSSPKLSLKENSTRDEELKVPRRYGEPLSFINLPFMESIQNSFQSF